MRMFVAGKQTRHLASRWSFEFVYVEFVPHYPRIGPNQ